MAFFKAAEDSCKLMGNRRFYDQMIIDACQQHQDKITNELDINTMKDVMQVSMQLLYFTGFKMCYASHVSDKFIIGLCGS